MHQVIIIKVIRYYDNNYKYLEQYTVLININIIYIFGNNMFGICM